MEGQARPTLAMVLAMMPSHIDRLLWQGQSWLRQIGEWVQFQLQQWWQAEGASDQAPPPWLETLLQWGVRVLAVVLVAGVLFWGCRQLQGRWLRSRPAVPAQWQRPVETTRTVAQWLAAAQQLQQQQDYTAALRALYMALLQHLEALGWLAQNAAGTDQEYLQQLEALLGMQPQHSVQIAQHWRQIIQAHETAYYGAQPVEAPLFQQCQQAYQVLAAELRSPQS
ncbi:DUF4129 domain-containing protein [Synechococcales cyanobacterium C]|uniref:DUF4129 domain-containing protein n=1 Tax=Petrachloros mirabilis ULC683 TaxID=2781853 RepID=A0A8K2A181_9CYAN|nr:DUF4129 domain-containing protein [Petrachloros mirabilis]NCJ07932.1 DUF4129 domain-containing protein [Petrachloros mirabilis ULC683]